MRYWHWGAKVCDLKLTRLRREGTRTEPHRHAVRSTARISKEFVF